MKSVHVAYLVSLIMITRTYVNFICNSSVIFPCSRILKVLHYFTRQLLNHISSTDGIYTPPCSETTPLHLPQISSFSSLTKRQHLGHFPQLGGCTSTFAFPNTPASLESASSSHHCDRCFNVSASPAVNTLFAKHDTVGDQKLTSLMTKRPAS